MSLKITVLKRGKTTRSLIKDLQDIDTELQFKINELGSRTAQKMRELIRSNTKHPTGNLERNITAEPVIGKNAVGVGIGNIDKLNRNAEYWRAINYGSRSYPIFTKNAKALKFKGKDGQDVYASSVARPKFLISPINYIEKTIQWLGSQLGKIILKIGNK